MRTYISFLCLLFLCLNIYAQKFTYDYNSVKFNCKIVSGKVCITGFNRNAEIVTIPNKVKYKGKKYDVISVDTYVKGRRYSTTNLTIEDGISEIANYSFLEFKNLNEITLPNSIKKIGTSPFKNKEDILVNSSDEVLILIYGEEWVKKNLKKNTSLKGFFNSTLNKAKSLVKLNKNDDNKSDIQEELNKEITKSSELIAQNKTTKTQSKANNAQKKELKKEVTKEFISDIEKNIPKSKQIHENYFAVIIANENYDVENNVEFALNDGKLFKTYCEKVFGIPEENIRFLSDATHMQIKRTMSWLKKVSKLYANECRIFFYYAGHGMPDESTGSAYILPTDGYASDIAVSGYKLSDLYSQLGNLPAKSITVFLDACFSGMKRDGDAIVAARSVAIEPEEENLNGNVIVFSATSEAETAYSYKEKGHGLFSYYLMKKLKESKGNISYKELSKYITTEVGRKSLTINDKAQTPTVLLSPAMENAWDKIKFKE